MKSTNINWTFGNFDVTVRLTAELDGPKADKVLEAAGLKWLQRKPASAVEKLLAGYEKRPEGFKRDSIPFSPERAEKVKAGFTLTETSLGITAECLSVTEHVKGVTDAPNVKAREALSRHESAGDLEEWLAQAYVMVGEARVAAPAYTGPTHTVDGEDYHPEAVANAVAKRRAATAYLDAI